MCSDKTSLTVSSYFPPTTPLTPQGDSRENPDAWLPKSQTCFFTLKLPRYSSLEVTREKLLKACQAECVCMPAPR